MNKQSFKGNLLLLTTATLVLSIGLATPQAFAVEGDVVQQHFCANSSVAIAFDGTDVWFMSSFTSATMNRCNAVTGLPGTPVNIVGLQGGDLISAFSYDGTRNVFWAVAGNEGPSHSVYQIANDGTGQATYMYDVNMPGIALMDGIAYDGEDDSLWMSPDVNANIWHFNALDGAPLPGSPFLIPKDPNNNCGNSGIAAGTGILYLGFNGCNIIQKHNKADLSLISSFVLNGASRVEDLECDNVTFPGIDAIWSKDANDVDIIAFEVPKGTCPTGGGGDPPIVGGEIIPISTTALILAGVQTNAAWILTALAGIASAAFGALYLTSKRN